LLQADRGGPAPDVRVHEAIGSAETIPHGSPAGESPQTCLQVSVSRESDSMRNTMVLVFVALIAMLLLPWGQPLVGPDVRPRDDHSASGVEVDDDGTEECAALQLRASVGTEAASQSPPSSGGNVSGISFIPPAMKSVAAARAETASGQQASLLSVVAQQSATALFDGSRVWAEHRRIRAQLDSARMENNKVRIEVAMLLDERNLLESKLIAQQAHAGRGPLNISFSHWRHSFWLVLAMISGSAGLMLLACVMCRRLPKRKSRLRTRMGLLTEAGQPKHKSKRDEARAAAHALVRKSGLGQLVKSEGEEEEEDEINRSILGCPASLWFVILFWFTGLAVMWHFGIVQPLLRQLVVFIMLALAVVGFFIIISFEAWARLQKRGHVVLQVLQLFHERIDHVLSALGFREEDVSSDSDEDDLDEQQPRRSEATTGR